MSIPNESIAKDFLLKNNYYRISGYSLTLRSHDIFYENTTFQNIIDIYSFDHEFRHILLQFIEKIEVTLKSIYAYEFTKHHEPTVYLDASYFTDPKKHAEIISKAESQRISRLPHESYLKHFANINQDIPLWAYVDLLTISDISFLYSISEKDIQEAVAASFGFKVKGPDTIKRSMHSITIIRNLCAHGNRLFNRIFMQKPWLKSKDIKILLKNSNGEPDNSRLFGFILIMRQMLNSEDFHSLKEQILIICQKYTFVRMSYYGFPEKWETKI